jgi:hypothetical protein
VTRPEGDAAAFTKKLLRETIRRIDSVIPAVQRASERPPPPPRDPEKAGT